MERVKKFFNIKSGYSFEYNDLRCVVMLVNVLLIMTFGLAVAKIGLAIAIYGTIRDLIYEEIKVNSVIMYISTIMLNCYFVSIM